MSDRIIRIKEVTHITGLGRSTIARMEEAGEFPKRIALTGRCVGWSLIQIQKWTDNKVKEKRR